MLARKTREPASRRLIEVQPSYGISDTEIERMLEESIEYAEQDFAETPGDRSANRGGDDPDSHAKKRSVLPWPPVCRYGTRSD